MKKNSKQLLEDLKQYFYGNSSKFPEKINYENDESTNVFFDIVDNPEFHHKIINLNKSDKEEIEELVDLLKNSINLEELAILRYVFHNLIKILPKDKNEDIILTEDLDSNIDDLPPHLHRAEALEGLEKYFSLNPAIQDLGEDMMDMILDGSTDKIQIAASMTKNIFANVKTNKNIKTAHTSLSTQAGEGYQMCPKAQKQIGYALPMELSKCRDYCIDSRKTVTGQITCAYQDWLTLVADNQESVLSRLANQSYSKNDVILGQIVRPGPAPVEKPRDQIMHESDININQQKKYDRENILKQSIESSLENRNLNNQNENIKKASRGSRSIIAEANNITKEMMRKFNLSEHIKGSVIEEQLSSQREYFKDTNASESASVYTNTDRNNEKYENATSMQSLLEERHVGNPKVTQEEQLETVRLGDIDQHNITQEDMLINKRKNDPLTDFMMTLEEQLEAKRKNS